MQFNESNYVKMINKIENGEKKHLVEGIEAKKWLEESVFGGISKELLD